MTNRQSASAGHQQTQQDQWPQQHMNRPLYVNYGLGHRNPAVRAAALIFLGPDCPDRKAASVLLKKTWQSRPGR